MANQISGSDKTILNAINDGDIQRPALMSWNAWQQWRARGGGLRPTLERDGYSTTNTQEVAWYKEAMAELHGANWAVDLITAEAEAERAAAATGARASGLPSGSAAELPPTTSPRPTTQEVSPASGDIGSPGSGGTPSWKSSSPGTPGTLTAHIKAEFNPARESVEKYLGRLERQVQVLSNIGDPVDDTEIAVVRAKAQWILSAYEGAAGDEQKTTRILKREYAFLTLDDAATPENLAALEELLLARGEDSENVKRLAAIGQEVAPTPVSGPRGTSARLVPPFPGQQASHPEQYRLDTGRASGQPELMEAKTPGGTALDQATEERIRSLELQLAANKVGAAAEITSPVFAQVLERQTEILTQLMDKPDKPYEKRHKASTFKVEPRLPFPNYGDDGSGGREAEDFFEKFEDITSLANDGDGMSDKEMVMTLRLCLKGSRKTIYENILKEKKETLVLPDGYGEVYRLVKVRLLKFLETPVERQMRVTAKWRDLQKKKGQTALQFEAEWEKVHAELEEIGLGVKPMEKFLEYIIKVGYPINEQIRMDRRPRSDRMAVNPNEAAMVTRCPETWEEAHEVMSEIESIKASTRAFNTAAKAAGMKTDPPQNKPVKPKTKSTPSGGANQSGGAKGGGKGGGKGKGKDQNKGSGVCFEFRDKGSCQWGDKCRFSHDIAGQGGTQQSNADKNKAKRERQKAAKEYAAAQEAEAGGAKGGKKGGGKGKGANRGGKGGKGGGGGGNQRKPQATEKQRKTLCKFVKDPNNGQCPKGKALCPYSHDKRCFDLNDGCKWVGRKGGKGGRGGAQQDQVDDSWDTPVGVNKGGAMRSGVVPIENKVFPQVVSISHDGKEETFTSPQTLVASRERAESGTGRPGSERPDIKYGKPTGCSDCHQKITAGKATAYRNDGGGAQQTFENRTGLQMPKGGGGPPALSQSITTLSELPNRCWTEERHDDSGTQFFTQVKVGKAYHELMLDTGSGVNSVTEELIVQILNEQAAAGVKLNDPRHPIKQLGKWRHKETLRGVAGGAAVPLLGTVIVELNMIEVGKDDGPKILARFKITKKGTTDWVGWILGARALDSSGRGGLGFMPMDHTHSFSTLGIQMERTEAPGGEKIDECYATRVFPIRCAMVDSDAEEEYAAPARPDAGTVQEHADTVGIAVVYEGDPITLSEGEGAWIPVVTAAAVKDDGQMMVVLPSVGSPVEAVPGIWDSGNERQGMLCVTTRDEFDIVLEPGVQVAEVHSAAVQTRVCQGCGGIDTDAWLTTGQYESKAGCNTCGITQGAGPSSCRQCGADSKQCCVVSYAGCEDCRPERVLKGKVRRGPAAGLLARAGLAFATMCCSVEPVGSMQALRQGSASLVPRPGQSTANEKVYTNKVFHIIEEPGGIRHLTECEVPTEEFNDARIDDLAKRHPKMSPAVKEHLGALEPFLDISIMAGFSYGSKKAFMIVTEGSLLGHKVGRFGSRHEPEKTQAIDDFHPLRDVSEVRQFVGSTNWVRRYLLPCYAAAVKILGEYMKPGAEFPPKGLGHPESKNTRGCKAVKCIKLLCKHAMHLSVLDEASAIDGSRPLEQVADACGIAWGATHLQMTPDLAGFKVLAMVGKGFTPAQQAWSPLLLEAFAQLGGKRAQKKNLGPMRSLMWSDHANVTKQQNTST